MEQELVMEAASSADGERQGSAFGEIGAVTRAADFKSTAADDMLSSEDIVKGGFQWRTPLLVLSACNSSRGQDYSDGEINLPRALMIAGVPAAVVSQWKVDDSASPRLMEAFYKNLKCGQNVARALQSAMMQLSAPGSGNADNIFAWGPFLVWGLPNVQLPQELWTENARKALPAKEKAELLRCKLNDFNVPQDNAFKLNLFQKLQAVDHFLEYLASCNASALGDEAIKLNAVIGVEELLSRLSCSDFSKFDILEVVSALAEQFYAKLLPLEEMKVVELELEKREDEPFMIRFWAHMMYTQAMRGKHEIALDYCKKLIKVSNKCAEYNSETRLLDTYVILRLMGKYEEAFEGFDDSLAEKETYECLMQTSYLKYLMKDEIGALVYALRAKKMGDAKRDKPSYGKLDSLVVNALPDETFCQWLLNVDESALTENVRKALAAKEQILLLGWKFKTSFEDVEEGLRALNNLKPLDIFVESVYSACALEANAVVDAILTAESLFSLFHVPCFSKESIALAEEFYTIFIFDQLNWAELELEKQPGNEHVSLWFRCHLMYMQAMRGSLQIALDYANKMIEIAHSADGCGYAELVVQEYRENKDLVRQERAVILRLMGRYDEALKEFEDILATEEDYECLIQTSYLKHLMEDESGALEYARRAKKIEPPEICKTSYGAFRLSGFKTLPNEYRLWLLKVDAGSVGPASSSVAGMSSVQPPPEACTERALPARTPIHLRPLYTPNCHHFCTEGT